MSKLPWTVHSFALIFRDDFASNFEILIVKRNLIAVKNLNLLSLMATRVIYLYQISKSISFINYIVLLYLNNSFP